MDALGVWASSLLGYLKFACAQATRTPFTACWFLVALLLCLTEVALQGAVYTFDKDAQGFVTSVISEAGVDGNRTVFALLESRGVLVLCAGLPGSSTSGSDPCVTLAPDSTTSPPRPTKPPDRDKATDKDGDDDEKDDDDDEDDDDFRIVKRATIDPQFDSTTGLVSSVKISDFGSSSPSVVISRQCVNALHWPKQELADAVRDDIALLVFHLWLFGISCAALIFESIPCVIVTVVATVIDTFWAVGQIVRSDASAAGFQLVVAGAYCDGINVLPNYWITRRRFEIPILALDVAALLIICFLSWKLSRAYGWHYSLLRRSTPMKRAFFLNATFATIVLLACPFIIANHALWISDLFFGEVAPYGNHRLAYQVAAIASIILIIPCYIAGWLLIQRERTKLAIVFLAALVVFIAENCAIFVSPIFRYSFSTWAYFGMATVASFTLLLITFILGVLCVVNFGSGLNGFLEADAVPWGFEGLDPDPSQHVMVGVEVHTDARPWTPALQGQTIYKTLVEGSRRDLLSSRPASASAPSGLSVSELQHSDIISTISRRESTVETAVSAPAAPPAGPPRRTGKQFAGTTNLAPPVAFRNQRPSDRDRRARAGMSTWSETTACTDTVPSDMGWAEGSGTSAGSSARSSVATGFSGQSGEAVPEVPQVTQPRRARVKQISPDGRTRYI